MHLLWALSGLLLGDTRLHTMAGETLEVPVLHREFCSYMFLLNHMCIFTSHVCREVAGHKYTFSAADPEVDISKDDKHLPMAANLSVRNLSGPHFILGHQ